MLTTLVQDIVAQARIKNQDNFHNSKIHFATIKEIIPKKNCSKTKRSQKKISSTEPREQQIYMRTLKFKTMLRAKAECHTLI